MKNDSALIKDVWYSPNIMGRNEFPMVVFLIDGTKISINRKGMSAWLEIKQEEKLTQKTIKDPKLNAMAKLHLIEKSLQPDGNHYLEAV